MHDTILSHLPFHLSAGFLDNAGQILLTLGQRLALVVQNSWSVCAAQAPVTGPAHCKCNSVLSSSAPTDRNDNRKRPSKLNCMPARACMRSAAHARRHSECWNIKLWWPSNDPGREEVCLAHKLSVGLGLHAPTFSLTLFPDFVTYRLFVWGSGGTWPPNSRRSQDNVQNISILLSISRQSHHQTDRHRETAGWLVVDQTVHFMNRRKTWAMNNIPISSTAATTFINYSLT